MPAPEIFGPFAAVLFDLDGTLVDSAAGDLQAWLQWITESGLEPDRLGDWHGRPARRVVAELLGSGCTERDLDAGEARVEALQIDFSRDVVPLSGAREALGALAGSGRSAIVTSCSRPLAAARLKFAQLPEPDLVVTVDDVKHGKPDPEPFCTAAHRLGHDPRTCLAVEDAKAGLASATAAGCTTLQVGTAHSGGDMFADFACPDLSFVRIERSDRGIELGCGRSIRGR
jgi:sugar-phosphatase